ncbi:MAG TPA: gas vesicle protein GvpD basic region 2 domain-containing protein [Thermoplasmata archaeon]|nr:gas vesicle protein GvpD basic region 2 domain-containing protein [Thermoplasmata archaeon]
MRAAARTLPDTNEWKPRPDPEGRYSTGIADFDRLIGGGFRRGSMVLVGYDETVTTEDLDLLLFPSILNTLYHSRGMIAILPSRDSPHDFRARLTRFATRRRFDSRVRIVDYAGEDEGLSYVVTIQNKAMEPGTRPGSEKEKKAAIEKMVQAEKAAAGSRNKPFLELYALEVMETLMGADQAARMFFHGAKRSRQLGNLLITPLAPGLGTAVAARRMADSEVELHHDEVGLIIRGIRPSFPGHVVTTDNVTGPPYVAFVPRPS